MLQSRALRYSGISESRRLRVIGCRFTAPNEELSCAAASLPPTTAVALPLPESIARRSAACRMGCRRRPLIGDVNGIVIGSRIFKRRCCDAAGLCSRSRTLQELRRDRRRRERPPARCYAIRRSVIDRTSPAVVAKGPQEFDLPSLRILSRVVSPSSRPQPAEPGVRRVFHIHRFGSRSSGMANGGLLTIIQAGTHPRSICSLPLAWSPPSRSVLPLGRHAGRYGRRVIFKQVAGGSVLALLEFRPPVSVVIAMAGATACCACHCHLLPVSGCCH